MVIPVTGLGAGGHAKVVVEILRNNEQYDLVGLLDIDPTLHGQDLLGVPILGSDDLLPRLYTEGVRHFFIGVGSVSDLKLRRRLYELVRSFQMKPVNALHPQSIISPSARLGAGATVMAGAIINTEAVIGDNVIVNSGAIVEHDCLISDHVHIATGARLASTVRVGTGAHIGAGATVKQCVSIGEDAVVGAGAVVVKDVPPSVTVVGVPARILSR